MRVQFDPEYSNRRVTGGRNHPWTEGEEDPNFRYYDFKASPELIETVLEDFKPYDDYPAVQKFYDFLRFVNGPDSAFESNDCAFRLEANVDPNGKKLRAYGRVLLLVRDLIYNTHDEAVNYYLSKIGEDLHHRDREFELGAVLLTKFPTLFVDLPQPPEKQEGSAGEILFWAWGDDEAEAMENLSRLFANLTAAVQNISEHIKASLAKASRD
jgi:hypothetical protein